MIKNWDMKLMIFIEFKKEILRIKVLRITVKS